MGIKTEDFVKNLPPKEMTEGIDWLGILDSFDPTVLEEKFINECARRNPCETCYRWERDGIASRPIEDRLNTLRTIFPLYRMDLEYCARRIKKEGLSLIAYKNARAALIKAIGKKGAEEYNRREYERLGEEGRKKQAEAYSRRRAEQEKQEAKEAEEYEKMIESGGYWYQGYYESEPASVHEKVIKVRKGVLGSNGRPMPQRDFAKYIGYPVTKYIKAEKMEWRSRSHNSSRESKVEYELLEKLIMICHANPYWIFDDSEETAYAEYGTAGSDSEENVPYVFATPEIISKWIESGKPRSTHWERVRLMQFLVENNLPI